MELVAGFERISVEGSGIQRTPGGYVMSEMKSKHIHHRASTWERVYYLSGVCFLPCCTVRPLSMRDVVFEVVNIVCVCVGASFVPR